MQKKSLLILIVCTLFSTACFSKTIKHSKKSQKNAKARKISVDDAKELCLVNMGASIQDEELKNCVTKVLKTKKV